MDKIITINETHIVNGERCKTGFCPIALALKEADIGRDILVGTYHASYFDHFTGRLMLLPLPREAREFIKTYDAGGDVVPFSWEIAPLPDEQPFESLNQRR